MNQVRNNMNVANLIIVDESPLSRKAIKRLLVNQLRFKIIGNTPCQSGLQHKCYISNADVVLFDLHIPKLSSIYTAKEWIKLFPKTKIIALTEYCDTVLVGVLEEIGFKGCVSKSELTNEIVPAIECVLNGGSFFTAK